MEGWVGKGPGSVECYYRNDDMVEDKLLVTVVKIWRCLIQTGINDMRDFTDKVCVRKVIIKPGARRLNCCNDGIHAKLDGRLCLNPVMKDSGQQTYRLCSLNDFEEVNSGCISSILILLLLFFIFLLLLTTLKFPEKSFIQGHCFESLSSRHFFHLVLFHPPFINPRMYMDWWYSPSPCPESYCLFASQSYYISSRVMMPSYQWRMNLDFPIKASCYLSRHWFSISISLGFVYSNIKVLYASNLEIHPPPTKG